MPNASLPRGLLLLVFGPSGAGKDSLIDATLAKRPDIVKPLRSITRPADNDSEIHTALSTADFRRAEQNGAFLLSWQAHGLSYGIPANAKADLALGRTVIANISRQAIPAAEALGLPLALLCVTADVETRRQRIATRGREDTEDVAERVTRSVPLPPTRTPITTIENNGSLEDGVAQFMKAIETAERKRAML